MTIIILIYVSLTSPYRWIPFSIIYFLRLLLLQRFSSILLDGLKDGGAKNNMVFSFENCGNVKMTGSINAF